MITFLPDDTYSGSVAVLDYRRLGNQRNEAFQIMLVHGDGWAWSVYTGKRSQQFWSTHWHKAPAVKMWRDWPLSLRAYYNFCIEEWEARGFENNMPYAPIAKITYPNWYDDRIVFTHRCKLLQKDYNHYSKFGWNVGENWRNIRYYWPE